MEEKTTSSTIPSILRRSKAKSNIPPRITLPRNFRNPDAAKLEQKETL